VLAFVDRLGAALVAPGRALAAAERGDGGMADALTLILLKVVCTETPLLVASLWSLVVLGPSVALRTLSARLAGVVGADLILLVVGGILVTVAAGRRRDGARDFDLAAVAWVPVLFVDTIATLGARVTGASITSVVRAGMLGVALLWMGHGLARGIAVARARAT
jgi:hypothetical protein